MLVGNDSNQTRYMTIKYYVVGFTLASDFGPSEGLKRGLSWVVRRNSGLAFSLEITAINVANTSVLCIDCMGLSGTPEQAHVIRASTQ